MRPLPGGPQRTPGKRCIPRIGSAQADRPEQGTGKLENTFLSRSRPQFPDESLPA